MRGQTTRTIRMAVFVTAVAALTLGMAAPAFAHNYSYWYQLPSAKVFKSTPPPLAGSRHLHNHMSDTTPAVAYLGLEAAQGEYEGRQLVVRPLVYRGESVRDFWIEPSDLIATDASGTELARISASEIETFKVHYVYVRTRSSGVYGTGNGPGYQPDALPPMTLASGNRVSSAYRRILYGNTQPFYVLFHVPDGTPAGWYIGTLTLTAKDDAGNALKTVVVPVKLKVYGFSIARRTLRSAMGVNVMLIKTHNTATGGWLTPGPASASRVAETDRHGRDQYNQWLKYFYEHRLTPQTLTPAMKYPTATGEVYADQTLLRDFMGSGDDATYHEGEQFGFDTACIPDGVSKPAYVKNPFVSSSYRSKAATYLRSMNNELKSAGYGSAAVVYVADEPTIRERGWVQTYASFAHYYAPGAKYLVTFDPGAHAYRPIPGIDIYVHRLHFWYRDYARFIVPQRRVGKQFWMYSHATAGQGTVPLYLIDKQLVDSRVIGWYAYQGQAKGLLYYNVNRWYRASRTSTTYRDPYVDPLSIQMGPLVANGDGSMLYPGYYPMLGLVVQGAPPVGSLRMEALRDGIEDMEYLKVLASKRGSTAANAQVKRVIYLTRLVGGNLRFPSYTRSAAIIQSARRAAGAAAEL